LELLNFLRIVINTYDVMADIGETGAGHKANVTGTDD
jgi:hypothetical protein